MNDGVVTEMGYEGDRHPEQMGPLGVRWWLYVFVPGEKLRSQRARLGVTDRGFRFARGGRVDSPKAAEEAIFEAYADARREADYWTGQPSHQLGPRGELVPLDEVLPELTA